eukprot:CAMPEP_0179284570 /NCGR_PEP_ID=MMETSP0797-20121207/38753_1 /TAXON_ID=47934 /ORGANISM="Dinophysis acuminata, Strain DAEP01" /LENGTH=41 /DNA_ID= /DNA_START= /DNA_END= /DNA_ORIENTATION=
MSARHRCPRSLTLAHAAATGRGLRASGAGQRERLVGVAAAA